MMCLTETWEQDLPVYLKVTTSNGRRIVNDLQKSTGPKSKCQKSIYIFQNFVSFYFSQNLQL